MKARIQDVAEKSDVSISTVSRFLNGGKNVSEKAQKRIRKAISELDYTPNFMAQTLVKKSSNLIGVIIPDIRSSFDSTMLCTIEEYTTARRYNIAICNIADNLEKECDYLRHLSQMNVCGLIVMNEKQNEQIHKIISGMAVPTAFCGCMGDDPNETSIIVDDQSAARDATRYLLGMNHRRIAYIGGDMRDQTSRKRVEGFQRAMNEAGNPPEEQYIKYGDYKIEGGYCLMQELLRCDPLPTAVFASNDDMAVGALNCILDGGYSVPEDFSLIGFDGSYLAEIVRPKLTTMQQPIRQMAEMSVQIIIDQITGKSAMVNQIILKHELRERQSCRRI
jgi:LacI family transcriptional regulator